MVILRSKYLAEAGECCCNCFSSCCRGISNFFDRPFSCWAVFCVVLLAAGAVCCFLYAGKHWAVDYCEHSLHIGLVVLGICYLIQNFTNFYTVYRFSRMYGKHSDPQASDRAKNICEATKKFLCYDFFMCFFILFMLFSIVWACLYIGYATDRSPSCRCIFSTDNHNSEWKRANSGNGSFV